MAISSIVVTVSCGTATGAGRTRSPAERSRRARSAVSVGPAGGTLQRPLDVSQSQAARIAVTAAGSLPCHGRQHMAIHEARRASGDDGMASAADSHDAFEPRLLTPLERQAHIDILAFVACYEV